MTVAASLSDVTVLVGSSQDWYLLPDTRTDHQGRRLTDGEAVNEIVFRVDLVALADAPIFLGEEASDRFRLLVGGERPAPRAPALPLDAF